jgi:integrase
MASSSYGHGMVRKSGVGSWELRWYVKAEKKYHSKTVRGTENQARKELRSIIVSVDQNTYVKRSKTTVGDIMALYLESIKSKSAKTIHTYGQIIRLYLMPGLGEYEVDGLEVLVLDRFFAGLETTGRYRMGGGGLSQTTRSHCRRILGQVFNWAVRKRIIRDNPVKLTDPITVPHNEMTILSESELNRLISNCSDNIWGMPIVLSALTGARQGECLGLTWENVDYENRTINICQALQCINGRTEIKSPKNEYSRRIIPIRDTLINALKQHWEKQQLQKQEWGEAYNDDDLVCARENGTAMVGPNVTYGLKLLLGKLELPVIRFHDLRHTHASILLKTQPIQAVSKRLGHKNAQVTWSTYCHLLPGMADTAADAFEEIIS